MITKPHSIPSFFSNLSDMLNQSHPLYKLADKIDRAKFGRIGQIAGWFDGTLSLYVKLQAEIFVFFLVQVNWEHYICAHSLKHSRALLGSNSVRNKTAYSDVDKTGYTSLCILLFMQRTFINTKKNPQINHFRFFVDIPL